MDLSTIVVGKVLKLVDESDSVASGDILPGLLQYVDDVRQVDALTSRSLQSADPSDTNYNANERTTT